MTWSHQCSAVGLMTYVPIGDTCRWCGRADVKLESGVEYAKNYHEWKAAQDKSLASIQDEDMQYRHIHMDMEILIVTCEKYRQALLKIHKIPYENNEWNGTDKFHDCQNIAFKALYDEPR